MFSNTLILTYFPIPFFLTAIYSVLVYNAQSGPTLRLRTKVLSLILWFNLLGIPLIFVVANLLFFPPVAIFDAVRIGFLFGAFSSSPFLAVMVKDSKST